jgi:hypothetical protein
VEEKMSAETKDLLLAILAMDSYNRGYGAGLADGKGDLDAAGLDLDGLGGAGSHIGLATLLDYDLPSGSKAAGFYAAAYQLLDGEVVISYRGTDNPFDDLIHGWTMGAGFDSAQGPLALQFYSAVTHQSYQDGIAAKTILTGHSLGGGLAGYVSALTGTPALIFDHMPFAQVANDNAGGRTADERLARFAARGVSS